MSCRLYSSMRHTGQVTAKKVKRILAPGNSCDLPVAVPPAKGQIAIQFARPNWLRLGGPAGSDLKPRFITASHHLVSSRPSNNADSARNFTNSGSRLACWSMDFAPLPNHSRASSLRSSCQHVIAKKN